MAGDVPCQEPENRETRPCSRARSENQAGDSDLKSLSSFSAPWMIGRRLTPAGPAPLVSPRLKIRDVLGAWRVRWGIRRNRYRIEPGLYAIGRPEAGSPVLVTANYKLTFDKLRKELRAVDAWILVLDTKGINVWCAAGKGTFGTDEIVCRVEQTGLPDVVTHRRLILPQLGAPGVAAHEVHRRCGFRVVYGPIRAKHISAFLVSHMKAEPSMRRVRFGLWDRIVLTPVELTNLVKPVLMVLGGMAILDLVGLDVLQPEVVLAGAGAVLSGTIVVPALLPWIPGRSFALKGWLVGLLWVVGYGLSEGWFSGTKPDIFLQLAALLGLPAITASIALNFTGSSVYTSLSGVEREMKYAIPALVASLCLGFLLSMTALLRGVI